MNCLVCKALTLPPERAFFAGVVFARLSADNSKLAKYMIHKRLCPLHAKEAARATSTKGLNLIAIATVADTLSFSELSVLVKGD